MNIDLFNVARYYYATDIFEPGREAATSNYRLEIRLLFFLCLRLEPVMATNSSLEEVHFNKERTFVGVDYPAVVRNVDKMLETLGGEATVSKVEFCLVTYLLYRIINFIR